MTTPSPRLKLKVPAQSDRFSTQDLIDNWNLLDAAPGLHICTSTTRPSDWGAAQAGRLIYETNTRLEWGWTGSAWVRVTGGTGILKRSDGSFAVGERTTDFATGSSTPVRAVSVTNVVVPDGHRTIMAIATWKDAGNPGNNDHFPGYIYRSNTNNSGPLMGAWQIGTIGGTFVVFERNGLAAGTYDFSFQITAPSGTSTLQASATTPISIAIIEL